MFDMSGVFFLWVVGDWNVVSPKSSLMNLMIYELCLLTLVNLGSFLWGKGVVSLFLGLPHSPDPNSFAEGNPSIPGMFSFRSDV